MRTGFQKRVISAAVLAATGGLALLSPRAQAAAVLSITLSEPGFAPQTFSAAPGVGQLTYTLAYGTYNLFNLEIAASDKNQSPAPALATLQIQGIVESTTANGSNNTLTIVTNDNGYNFPGAPGSSDFLDSSLGGTLAPPSVGDNITFFSTATGTDGVPSSNVSTGLQSYTYPGPVPQNNISFNYPDQNTFFTRGSLFDLTNTLSITLQSPIEQANIAGTTTVSFTQSKVPEPTSAMALLAGLGSMVLGRRRRV